VAMGIPDHSRCQQAPGTGTRLSPAPASLVRKEKPRARGTPHTRRDSLAISHGVPLKTAARPRIKTATQDHERSRLGCAMPRPSRAQGVAGAPVGTSFDEHHRDYGLDRRREPEDSEDQFGPSRDCRGLDREALVLVIGVHDPGDTCWYWNRWSILTVTLRRLDIARRQRMSDHLSGNCTNARNGQNACRQTRMVGADGALRGRGRACRACGWLSQ
jgi:hypothetical protein